MGDANTFGSPSTTASGEQKTNKIINIDGSSYGGLAHPMSVSLTKVTQTGNHLHFHMTGAHQISVDICTCTVDNS